MWVLLGIISSFLLGIYDLLKKSALQNNLVMPVLIGELGSFSKNNDNWMKINHQISLYALKDKNTLVVNTSDLNDKGDRVHFD